MWAKIEIISSLLQVVYLPPSLAAQFKEPVKVTFGQKTTTIEVRSSNDLVSGKVSYENPITIKMSRMVNNQLLMPNSLIYRLKLQERRIIFGPVIGLLLPGNNICPNPGYMQRFSEQLKIYNQVGGLVYGFNLKSIDWNKRIIYGLYYNPDTSSWKRGNFPFPDAVYRRSFKQDYSIIRFIKATAGKLFNSYRFSKLELFEYVGKHRELSAHLPPTELAINYNQIRHFIDEHNSSILKPTSRSMGIGICTIERKGDYYLISDYRQRRVSGQSHLVDEKLLNQFLALNQSFFDNYLIQKLIPLAKFRGSVFDIRVVMQKNIDAIWKCTGVECRVAPDNSLLTNIARGGYPLTLDQALRNSLPEPDCNRIKIQIEDFCENLCLYLDTMEGNHFAEFGIDVALDRNNSLWLLEVNARPTFKGFKTLDYPTYRAIQQAPLLYALSVAGFHN